VSVNSGKNLIACFRWLFTYIRKHPRELIQTNLFHNFHPWIYAKLRQVAFRFKLVSEYRSERMNEIRTTQRAKAGCCKLFKVLGYIDPSPVSLLFPGQVPRRLHSSAQLTFFEPQDVFQTTAN
jgi:hypothetical protein